MILTKNMVILDTETTGFSKNDEVIEIGIIDYQGNELFSHLIKIDGRIPFEASKVNGIYDHMLKDESYIYEYKDELKRILKDKVIVGYNVEFDVRLLRQSFEKYGIQNEFKGYLNETIDAMSMFSDYIGLPNKRGLGFRLSEASEIMKINIEQDHRATSDCMLTLELLEKMNHKNKGEISDKEIYKAVPDWKARKIAEYIIYYGRNNNVDDEEMELF